MKSKVAKESIRHYFDLRITWNGTKTDDEFQAQDARDLEEAIRN